MSEGYHYYDTAEEYRLPDDLEARERRILWYCGPLLRDRTVEIPIDPVTPEEIARLGLTVIPRELLKPDKP
jgi:hypothetical protein